MQKIWIPTTWPNHITLYMKFFKIAFYFFLHRIIAVLRKYIIFSTKHLEHNQHISLWKLLHLMKEDKNIAIQKIEFFVLRGAACTPSTLVLQQLVMAERSVPHHTLSSHAITSSCSPAYLIMHCKLSWNFRQYNVYRCWLVPKVSQKRYLHLFV